jgi:hypothetical protein
MEAERSLPHHKSPPLVPILSQIDPVHALIPLLKRSILILFSQLRQGLVSGLSFPQVSPPKPCTNLSSRATVNRTNLFQGPLDPLPQRWHSGVKTSSLRSSLNVSDQLNNRKIIALFILIFTFLDSKLEDKNSAPDDSKHYRFTQNISQKSLLPLSTDLYEKLIEENLTKKSPLLENCVPTKAAIISLSYAKLI